MSDNPQSLVLDLGSGILKAGFAVEYEPQSILPSVVGRRKYTLTSASMHRKETYVGSEAQSKRGILALRYPIEHGIVTDWEGMEVLLSHTLYTELCVAPEEHPILFTEAPFNPTSNGEKMAEILFETFNAPAIYNAISGVLALYASGRNTGVVLDCGDGVVQALPVMESYPIVQGILRQNLAGRDVTHHMMKALAKRGLPFLTSAEREIARDIKEKLSYVALDFDAETLKYSETPIEHTYELPDGSAITIGNECFLSPEILFQPGLVGLEQAGVHNLLFKSIFKSDIDARRDLLANIVLSGGSTLLKGFADRLKKEILNLLPPTCRVKVIASNQRKYFVWVGGSILASLHSFQKALVTRDMYDEQGPSCIHRRTFV